MSLPLPVARVTETFLAEVDARLPGELAGLFLHGSIGWGEFFAGSDVDAVGVWHDLPEPSALDRVGESAETVVWVTLGVARLHHLLATGELTSKSGAGRYVLEELEERWHPLADDALALREGTGAPSAYADTEQRGRDLLAFLTWAVADGLANS